MNFHASVKPNTLYVTNRVSIIGQHSVHRSLGKEVTVIIIRQHPVTPPTAAFRQLRKMRG